MRLGQQTIVTGDWKCLFDTAVHFKFTNDCSNTPMTSFSQYNIIFHVLSPKSDPQPSSLHHRVSFWREFKNKRCSFRERESYYVTFLHLIFDVHFKQMWLKWHCFYFRSYAEWFKAWIQWAQKYICHHLLSLLHVKLSSSVLVPIVLHLFPFFH